MSNELSVDKSFDRSVVSGIITNECNICMSHSVFAIRPLNVTKSVLVLVNVERSRGKSVA